MKKILSLLLSFSLLISAFGIMNFGSLKKADASVKEIDVYFIAGQSNAAGQTQYSTITTTAKPEYSSGY
ncbi:MAG: hypothetical protein MJ072_05355, partial [Clostridia bacterium]|nr:hypothetical protein [Clostridia bacterium]